MKYLFFFFLTMVLVSCLQRPKEDPILFPQINSSFYENSIRKLESEIQKAPDNVELINLQLTYYEKLGWPPKAYKAVKRAINVLDLEPVTSKRFADFFMGQKFYSDMIALADKLASKYESPGWLYQYDIEAHNKLGHLDETKQLMDIYEGIYNGQDDYWMAQQYLLMEDSLTAINFLLDAKETESNNEKYLLDLAVVAQHYGRDSIVLEDLNSYLKEGGRSEVLKRLYSLSLYNVGRKDSAKKTLLTSNERKSQELLIDWYKRDRQWRLAHRVYDSMLVSSTNKIEIWIKKADMDQQRGWLSQSLMNYRKALEIDSTDEWATSQADIVSRKLAYLQRKKSEKEEIPTLELESKTAKQ